MNPATAPMDAAMKSEGFARKKLMWRSLETRALPVVVYGEKSATASVKFGITVLWGWPHRDPTQWGCYQLSQREALVAGGDHYYDLSNGGAGMLERDFLEFTVPTVRAFKSGKELFDAVFDGVLPPSVPGQGEVGRIRNLLDISNAFGLDDCKNLTLRRAEEMAKDRPLRKRLAELAKHREDLQVLQLSPAPGGLSRLFGRD